MLLRRFHLRLPGRLAIRILLLTTIGLAYMIFLFHLPAIFLCGASGALRVFCRGSKEHDMLRRLFLPTSDVVDVPYCKVPSVEPANIIGNWILEHAKNITCKSMPSLTYTDGIHLKLNKTIIATYFGSNFSHCVYTPFFRLNDDWHINYLSAGTNFVSDVAIRSEYEYVRVQCFSRNGSKIFTNFHQIIGLKPGLEKRSEGLIKLHKTTNNPLETYNVHMIGIDSVSRLSFIRQLPKTYKLLRKEFQSFDMTSYNKVADGTIANLFPMLVGKYISETGWNSNLSDPKFDKYPFIWKKFSSAGYRTWYAEDYSSLGVFAYQKPGFEMPPTDYYNRPVARESEKELSLWTEVNMCVAGQLEIVRWLDYVRQFSRVFRNKPHFGFTFLKSLSHDQPTTLWAADAAFVNFFKTFKKEGHSKNTVVIFFSDHGYRYGRFTGTLVEQMEERLPVMHLIFPPSFHQKYPNLIQNLRINSRRLTTPFDIYETLKDILYFDGLTKEANPSDRGISLFREIPAQRTCRSADILPHWCMCLKRTQLDHTSQLARQIAREVVKEINPMLQPVKHLCQLLILKDIIEFLQLDTTEEENIADRGNERRKERITTSFLYQVTLTTYPGDAMFEATITYSADVQTVRLAGEASRLNMDKHQARCIKDWRLKKFCYCYDKK